MVLLGAALWGISGTAAQVLFQRDGYHPGWLVTVRMGISGVILLLSMSWITGWRNVFAIWNSRSDALRVLVFGVFGLLGVQYSYFRSIQYGNAATATLLQYLGPVLITLYLAWRHRKQPSRSEWTAVLLALCGTFFLVTDGKWGDIAISASAVVWGVVSAIALAFYTLYPKPLLQKYGSALITGWAMLIGSFFVGLANPPWQVSGILTIGSCGLISFVVIFGTLLAFYLYLSSLKYISATETSLLSSAEPLSATLVAVLFLHVHMGFDALLGGVCIVATVFLLARPQPIVHFQKPSDHE
ncbi:hypothetical protein BM613_10165 [Sulfoacidibacillus thermotolerans]|uniref:EamA domain-containing protein n=2 Tax=Sulfoacidibacillus thermotolerans TaxID=1765684 RepID=A0A2U3D795_SULT2|nr:hypothetical protein BM613_10165 [Sulfoacidibacillus thermotolerans]